MSWSFQAIGNTQRLVEALEAHSEKISKDPTDYCRMEFEAAKPHLIALVKQNFAAEGTEFTKPMIQLTASGSATSRVDMNDANKRNVVSSNVSVELKQHYNFVG